MTTSQGSNALQAASLVIFALIPLVMELATRSAPLVLGIAALVAIAGAILSGEADSLPEAMKRLWFSPLAKACLCLVALATASLSWGHHLKLAAFTWIEVAITIIAGLAAYLYLPRRLPRYVIIVAISAFLLTCALILFELSTGDAIRTFLGVRAKSFIFNRPAIILLIVFWPLAAMAWRDGMKLATAAMGILICAVLVFSDSGTAVLGAVAGVFAYILARISRRSSLWIVGAGMMLALAMAPFAGELAARVMPGAVVQDLQGAHARDRINIWRSFGAAARRRPILGTGFGTSAALASDPVASEVPADERVLLGAWHAHNAYLQVWTEMGAAGALAVAVCLVLLMRAVSRLPKDRAPLAVAVTAAAGAIMLVGYSPWQGWWIAALACSVIWLSRMATTGEPAISRS